MSLYMVMVDGADSLKCTRTHFKFIRFQIYQAAKTLLETRLSESTGHWSSIASRLKYHIHVFDRLRELLGRDTIGASRIFRLIFTRFSASCFMFFFSFPKRFSEKVNATDKSSNWSLLTDSVFCADNRSWNLFDMRCCFRFLITLSNFGLFAIHLCFCSAIQSYKNSIGRFPRSFLNPSTLTMSYGCPISKTIFPHKSSQNFQLFQIFGVSDYLVPVFFFVRSNTFSASVCRRI